MQTTRLSEQAITVLAVVLQKALIERASVVELLGQLQFATKNGLLEVTNPPTKIVISEEDLDEVKKEMAEKEE